jgi:hypothetical protein
MAWVYALDTDAALIGLIESKGIQLFKRPTMQAAFGSSLLAFASSHLRGIPNMGQVLKDNRGACGGMLDNTLGEYMIAITVESLTLATEFLQVTFGRLTSVRLQLAANAESAAVNLFPVATTEKLTMASHSGSVQSEVNANDFMRRRDDRFRHIDYDMQPELALPLTQVSSGDLASDVACAELRNRKGNAHLTLHSRETNLLRIPLENIGMNIVTSCTENALRACNRLEYRSSFATLQGFRHLLRKCRFFASRARLAPVLAWGEFVSLLFCPYKKHTIYVKFLSKGRRSLLRESFFPPRHE